MRNLLLPMKIPQKQIWLLAASLSFGQMAFSSGNYASEVTVANAIVQQSNKTVSGTVTDAYGPVIGASVVEGRTTNGTITDVDGNFSLSVPANSTLTISFVGYKTQTVPVNGKNSLKVTLQEDTEVLDEVVVVGYGTMKKSDLTGAVSSVGVKDIKDSPEA